MIEDFGVIVASATAIYGINQWRRELRGRKEYELAEEVLTLVYECRDRLRAIRSPFARQGEGASREAAADERLEETELLNRAYIVFERYEQHEEEFSRLFALRYRFRAIFGQEASAPLEDLRSALNDIFLSAQMLPSYWLRQGREPMEDDEFRRHLEEMREHESVFWGTFSERDVFDQKVNGIVTQVEAACSEIIRPVPLPKRIKRWFSSWK